MYKLKSSNYSYGIHAMFVHEKFHDFKSNLNEFQGTNFDRKKILLAHVFVRKQQWMSSNVYVRTLLKGKIRLFMFQLLVRLV